MAATLCILRAMRRQERRPGSIVDREPTIMGKLIATGAKKLGQRTEHALRAGLLRACRQRRPRPLSPNAAGPQPRRDSRVKMRIGWLALSGSSF
jgi:hypothetical protein